jgi:hypothetical protein
MPGITAFTPTCPKTIILNTILCPPITETVALTADQNPDSEMNRRISGIICKSPADKIFQSEQDTSGISGLRKGDKSAWE